MAKNSIILSVITIAWIFFITLSLWPASFWLKVNEISVDDSFVGDTIVLNVDREILRPFYADWTVTIRENVNDGYVIRCYTQASTDYRTDAKFPEPLTLTWWSNGQCDKLKEGSYIMTTTWDIRPNIPGLPKKTLTVESNPFRISSGEIHGQDVVVSPSE